MTNVVLTGSDDQRVVHTASSCHPLHLLLLLTEQLCVHTRACMYAYVHMYVCMVACVSVRSAYVHARAHICLTVWRMYVRARACVCACVCVHACIRAYVHACVGMPVFMSSQSSNSVLRRNNCSRVASSVAGFRTCTRASRASATFQKKMRLQQKHPTSKEGIQHTSVT